MEKCEWEDGTFLMCIGFKRSRFHYDNLRNFKFCPFCGADIRKPEPKPEYHNCRCKIIPDSDHDKERQLHLDLIKLVEYNKGLEFREAVRGALKFLLKDTEAE